MTALYIILGIIAFFVLLLSVRIQVDAEFFDSFFAQAKWLFIKIPLYPPKPKKESKPQKEKKPKEEKTEEKPAEGEKQENKILTMFKNFYENQGFDGVMDLLQNTADATEKMGASFKKHFVFRKLYLFMTVSENHDAAETALKYGKVCQKVFPVFGYLCSSFPVRQYDCLVEPDFLGNSNKAEFAVSISVRPIFMTNMLIAFAFRMLFNVVLKVLRKSKKPKPKTIENN